MLAYNKCMSIALSVFLLVNVACSSAPYGFSSSSRVHLWIFFSCCLIQQVQMVDLINKSTHDLRKDWMFCRTFNTSVWLLWVWAPVIVMYIQKHLFSWLFACMESISVLFWMFWELRKGCNMHSRENFVLWR